MNIVTPSTTSDDSSALRLTVMWFGIQLIWGAVLGISLQARCVQLAGPSSLALYGATSVCGAVAAALAQLVIGPLSDCRRRAGHRRIGFYVTGTAIAACAIVAFYISPAVVPFIASFIVLQLGMNIAIGPYQAILPDAVSVTRIGAASGWMAAMQSAGNATGAILATILGNTSTLGTSMAVILVACALVTIAHVQRIRLQPLPPATEVRITRVLVDLFISRAVVYIGFYTLLGYWYFYVRATLSTHAGVDATTATGIGILVFTIVGAIGAAIAARPSDRIDERVVVSVGGGIVAAATALLAYSANSSVGIVAIAIAGVGWGIFLCADWAYACRLMPPSALATSMAVWNIAVIGPQIAAPALTTAVLFRAGTIARAEGPRDAFLMATLELLLGTLWIWRLPRQARGN